jgi:hypothetical protein
VSLEYCSRVPCCDMLTLTPFSPSGSFAAIRASRICGCENGVRSRGYCANEQIHLNIHDIFCNQEVLDRWVFFKCVFGRLSALLLRLYSPSDESPDHIEFSPVDLRWMGIAVIRVPFMSANQVEQVDLPE